MAKFLGEEVYMGRERPWSQVSDFLVPADGDGVIIAKLRMNEIGNPSQIMMGRAGPDNVPYNYGRPEALPPGSTIGHIHFRGYEGHSSQGGREFGRRSAQIYSRYWKDAAGSLHFAVRRGGGDGPDENMDDVLVIEPDGSLDFVGVPTRVKNGQVQMRIKLGGRVGWLNLDLEP